MTEVKKYVAYYRVSTKKQGESGLGLEAQQAIVNYYAKNSQLLQEYVEVKSGGSLEGRTQLAAAVEHCLREDATLIVAKADRLSRDVEDALKIYKKLNKKLQCCDLPSNTDDFTLTLFFLIAQRERELTKIRTKAALEAKRQRDGKQIINGSPFHKRPLDLTKARESSAKVRRELSIQKQQKLILICKQFRKDGKSLGEIAGLLKGFGYKSNKNCELTATHVYRMLKHV